MAKRVLILTGRGRFNDLWHDGAATSFEIARSLPATMPDGEAISIEIRSTFVGALDNLATFDLLVLNISRPQPGYVEAGFDEPDAHWAAFIDRIAAWHQAGGPILAFHSTLLAAEMYPALANVLGGHWVEGVSGHPPISELSVKLGGPLASRISPDIKQIDTFDEEYQKLAISGAAHIFGGAVTNLGSSEYHRAPLIWLVESNQGRVIVSALGHDTRSFTPSHQQFLANAAIWLLAGA